MKSHNKFSLFLLFYHLITPAHSLIPFYNISRSVANFLFQAPFLETEDMTTMALVKNQGYPVETHEVTSEDGYILELHRIQHGRNMTRDTEKYPVILQHGNFQSSADWALESDSLGFYLADHGYDVWMGNQRGNGYSVKHVQHNHYSSAYWNFSFTEMGYYDLPAVVDYVLKTTGKNKTHYISYSMGSTAFFVGMSKRPELSDKIAIGIMMGPSTFQRHFWHGWVRLVAPFVWILQVFSQYAGDMPVLSMFFAKLLHKTLPVICHPKIDLFGVCLNVMLLGFGHDKGEISRERLHKIMKVSPSSSPMKAFFHEMQLMGTGRFCEYDYGPNRNMLAYGRLDPPDYNLTNVRAPVALVVGENDFLAHREDAKTLADKLPNLVEFHYVPYDAWTHLDFCYGLNASSLLHPSLVNLLRKYDNT